VTCCKVGTVVTAMSLGGFAGYRKRRIYDIERERKQEIATLERELERLGPMYENQLRALQNELDDLKDKENAKNVLWEDRLRRFAEETMQFAQFKEVVPQQLKELEQIGQMYWMAVKVLQDTRNEEQQFEETCRNINRALYVGSEALFSPNSITTKEQLLSLLRAVQKEMPDDLTKALITSAEKLQVPYEGFHALQSKFHEGLRLIEESQHSIAGEDYNSLSGRLFSKVHYTLTVTPKSPTEGKKEAPLVDAPCPPKIHSEDDLHQAITFANTFCKEAEAGSLKVPATQMPLAHTPEGKDALKHMRQWIQGAQSYLALHQHVYATNAYLTALCMRLGFPELPDK
jgi:hypothetical protein